MEIDLIGEALKFLVLGMSTVFMFLVLLVVVLNLQAKLVTKYFPAKKEHIQNNSSSLAVVAAIAASLQSMQQSK